jgi:hypothetical protein
LLSGVGQIIAGVANTQINPIKKVDRLFALGRRTFMPDYDTWKATAQHYDACTDGCCCNSTTGNHMVQTSTSV